MPTSTDHQRFKNEDLLLKVGSAVDRAKWNQSRYEAYLEELCGDREYQKEAIRTALRYLLGGEYLDLRALAKENFDNNPALVSRYGSWKGMERNLQLPDQLSASIDLATGTGKSYVLYGVASILLAEGAVDRVLVLCPSTTIENGLMKKFRELAMSSDLRNLLPTDAKITTPSVINASQSLTEGSICVENYHAVLEHVGSSIRDSLVGKGERAAVLNDEAHHVANEGRTAEKRWKAFLNSPDYNFRYVLGVSGTCYVGDDYFADVIYRYSLRQAMDQRYVKKVEYIAELPRTTGPDEKWQLVYNRHGAAKTNLKRRGLLPLTIVVTQTIAECRGVADDLRHFLVEHSYASPDDVDEKILAVYNNAPDVGKLPYVDTPASKVEWIIAVSMLNEGWDVKRVFQIVPHEERAFNSRLLIAQVLGRGLRVPEGWVGDQPTVTVFNHDAWAASIRHIVDEILENEKRISSFVMKDSPYNFELHRVEHSLVSTVVETPTEQNRNLLEKGYVNLSSELATEDVNIEFERAGTGETYRWQTQIRRRTYTPGEVAQAMYERLEDAQDPDDPDPAMRTVYTDAFPVEKLREIIETSLAQINKSDITDSMKQKFLGSLGTLRHTAAKGVRYVPEVKRHATISTASRPSDSVSVSELRGRKTLFFTKKARETLEDKQVETFDEVAEPGSGFKSVPVLNPHDFKTPLNVVIADSDNEQRFIKGLIDPENLGAYQAWIKSTSTRFYEIDYSLRKGERTSPGKFSPDFFVKVANDLTLVVEIKDDTEIREPSEENIKKNEYARKHFQRVADDLSNEGSALRYQFHFLSPKNFNAFFQHLREDKIVGYRSDLDVSLEDAI